MSKRQRQYIGILISILVYFLIHEGAHFIFALCANIFKEIKIIGLGIQVDIYADTISPILLGFFCLVGSLSTMIFAYIFSMLSDVICLSSNKVFKASMYYITLALLFIDPFYLSVLYHFFGGGDMNGISLLVPEIICALIYGFIFICNINLFRVYVFPKYKDSFNKEELINYD